MFVVVSGVFLLSVGGTDCVPYHLYPSGITADSEFSSNYSVDNLNDGRFNTVWATKAGEDYGKVYFDFFNHVEIKHLWMMECGWDLRDVYVLNSVNITQAWDNYARVGKFYYLWFQEFITDRATLHFNVSEGSNVNMSEVSFWGCNYTTTVPTAIPTQLPSRMPTNSPTNRSTVAPTSFPSQMPTSPTVVPTMFPTMSPSQMPTNSISTVLPTMFPTDMPTDSLSPSTLPTMSPTPLPIENLASSDTCIARVTDLLGVLVFVIVVAVVFLGFQLYRKNKITKQNAEDQVQLSLRSAAVKPGRTDDTNHNAEGTETNTILRIAGEIAKSKDNQVYSHGGGISFALDKVNSGGKISETRGAVEK